LLFSSLKTVILYNIHHKEIVFNPRHSARCWKE